MSLKLTLIFLLVSLSGFSQSISGLVIDKSTKAPIPFATIKTGTYTGVISNDKGYFLTNMEDVKDVLNISCVGYQNKTISYNDIKVLDFIIELETDITQLNDVYISNKKPNANAIIEEVKKNLSINYNNALNTYRIFKRSTYVTNFKKLAFEIEKAPQVKKKDIAVANDHLNALSKSVKNRNIIQFQDFQATLHVLANDSTKLQIQKATTFFEENNAFSVDQLQEKAQKIVLKYLDTTKTYKLKSGLFKIEDSLSLKDEKTDKRNEDDFFYIHKETRSNFKRSQFYDSSFLNNFLDTKLYAHTYNRASYKTNNLTHIINFKPKGRKGKYTGILYINDATYAITRVDYSFDDDQHGQKLNFKFLLGFKYSENISSGTMIFEKDSSAIYHPKYLNQTSGNYFYVKRDIKVIENSETKNKVNFSFELEGNNTNKVELLFTENSKLNLKDFNAIKQDSLVPFKKVFKFEDSVWNSNQTEGTTLLLKTLED